jgi:glycosyltransferase involved in cell wall biosynthesis
MSQKLILSMPYNSLSIGNVSYNITKELFNRKIQCVIFPRGVDLSAYNINPEFKVWFESSINNRYKKFDKDIPTLNIWHLMGSESKFSNKQYTLSFHETDSPTDEEVNIANQQEKLFFSSSWSVDKFQTFGADRVSFIPLGFDPDFKVIDKKFMPDVLHWVLGPNKFEKRKNTARIIDLWIKKYGNNKNHKLTICVTNPFLNKQQNGFDTNDILMSIFKGNKPFNVDVIPYQKTNAEINQLMNSADINLSGIANSEGWNLPAFNSAALGKTVIVTNVTAHKDWANEENAILIEPTGMEPVYDGVFFHQGQPVNQGNYYSFKDESIVEAFEKAEKLGKTVNTKGLELQQKFSYKNTVDKLLETINK